MSIPANSLISPLENLLIATRNYPNYAKKHKAKRQKVSQASAAAADSNWNLSEKEREICKFACNTNSCHAARRISHHQIRRKLKQKQKQHDES